MNIKLIYNFYDYYHHLQPYLLGKPSSIFTNKAAKIRTGGGRFESRFERAAWGFSPNRHGHKGPWGSMGPLGPMGPWGPMGAFGPMGPLGPLGPKASEPQVQTAARTGYPPGPPWKYATGTPRYLKRPQGTPKHTQRRPQGPGSTAQGAVILNESHK